MDYGLRVLARACLVAQECVFGAETDSDVVSPLGAERDGVEFLEQHRDCEGGI